MRWMAWTYCGMLTALHALYTLLMPSIFTSERPWGERDHIIDAGYTETFYLSRKLFAEFARRPLTSWLIDIAQWFNLPLKRSVVLVEYIGVFVTLLLLFYLSKKLTKSTRAAYLSVLVFASSFWFVHAFFAGIYAYDEPWQYVFLFASFLAIAHKRWFIFSVLFFVALIARESTLLLLPGIYLCFVLGKPLISPENFKLSIKTLWVVPAYGLFLFLIIQMLDLGQDSAEYMTNERFRHLKYSFANWEIAIDTCTSFLLAIILPLSLLFARLKMTTTKSDKPWIQAFWISLLLNTLITFTMTLGRETRIFAQPIALLSPFLGLYLLNLIQSVQFKSKKVSVTRLNLVLLSVFAILVMAILNLYFLEIYWPTDTRYVNGFQRYGFYTGVFSCIILFMAWCYNKYDHPLPLPRWFYLMVIALTIFFGSFQIGYKFKPLYAKIEQYIESHDSNALLIVSTNFPQLIQRHFGYRYDLVAGNFNFKTDYLRLLDQALNSEKNMVFAELEPSVQYAAPYALSTMSSVKTQSIIENGRLFYGVKGHEPSNDLSFSINQDTKQFITGDDWDNLLFYDGFEEYGPTLRVTLGDLGIDSLVSFGCRMNFFGEAPENGKLVVHVKDTNGQRFWKGILLSEHTLQQDTNWIYMSEAIDRAWSDSTEISFFVWNPSQKPMKLGDMEITLNTPFVSELRKKKSAEDILRLK